MNLSRLIAGMVIALLAIGVTFAIALPAGETLASNPKVKVCHIPPGNPDNAHVINVSQNAVAAHLAHGDFVGASCDPTATPTSTFTSVPATNTFTPVPPTSTFTPVPATNTFTPVPPTDTPTPVPPTDTPTPVPPTDTPTPDV